MDIKEVIDISNNLTVVAVLGLLVFAFITGRLPTSERLKDWQKLAQYERERADRKAAALEKQIDTNEEIIRLLQAIQQTILRVEEDARRAR